MSGGARGYCASPNLRGELVFGRGAGAPGAHRGWARSGGCGGAARGAGGWGYRNQYSATGLFGWQRGRGAALTEDERFDALKARERAAVDELESVRLSLAEVKDGDEQ
jgi:hypothetical protein